MPGTAQEIVEVKPEYDWNNVKTTVVTRLGETFQEYPDCFFTEHDIHSVLYNITKEELQRNGGMTAKCGQDHVLLVHHEYPTPFRCSMKGYDFELRDYKPYRRGHYDLVILNPEFVRKSRLDVACGKDYKKFRSAMQEVEVEPLIWACEVIFFPKVKRLPKNALKTVEQDTLKVKATLEHKVGSNVPFCKMGSVHVFASHSAEKMSELKRQIADLRKKHSLEVCLSTA